MSATAIRYYEEIGVLAPPARTPAGYRHYDDDAVERLAFVRAAQAVGLTLGEIRGVVALRDSGHTPCAHVLELIGRRSREVSERIAELEVLRSELERLTDRAHRLDPADCDPRRICHLVGPERPGVVPPSRRGVGASAELRSQGGP